MLSYLHAFHIQGSLSKSNCSKYIFMEASFLFLQDIAEIATEILCFCIKCKHKNNSSYLTLGQEHTNSSGNTYGFLAFVGLKWGICCHVY